MSQGPAVRRTRRWHSSSFKTRAQAGPPSSALEARSCRLSRESRRVDASTISPSRPCSDIYLRPFPRAFKAQVEQPTSRNLAVSSTSSVLVSQKGQGWLGLRFPSLYASFGPRCQLRRQNPLVFYTSSSSSNPNRTIRIRAPAILLTNILSS